MSVQQEQAHELILHPSRLPERRLSVDALMPPETWYRPASTLISSVNTFLAYSILLFMGMILMQPFNALLIFIFAVLLSSTWRRYRITRAFRENQEGVNLLLSGDVEEASDVFERLSRAERAAYGHAIYVFNRGVAYMLQGKPKRAFSLFNAIEKSRHFSRGAFRQFEGLLYVEMASCLALTQHLREAKAYRERASQRLKKAERARLIFVDVIIEIRRHRPHAACEILDQHWASTEGVLRASTLKALRLIYAFALESVGRANDPRYTAMLQGARPFADGEYDWIAVDWPELQEFLEAHGFVLR